jgi:outer membrane protein OmpA-like peptidoglycan-associated protein
VETSIIQDGLDYGHWYWRVTPIFPPQIRGEVLLSAVGEFSVIRGSPILAVPVPAPVTGNRLMWNHDTNAASWFVELADNPAMINPALRKSATSNFFAVSPDLLQAGQTWYWRVTALGGAYPAVSEVLRLEPTGDRPQPVTRPVIPAIPHFPAVIFSANGGDWYALADETSAANARTLSRIGQFLGANREFRLRVEGHANATINPVNIAGHQREHTEELLPLSAIRAQTVVDRLVELGVNSGQLEVKGLGGEHPLVAWGDRAHWWRNRRAEFTVLE